MTIEIVKAYKVGDKTTLSVNEAATLEFKSNLRDVFPHSKMVFQFADWLLESRKTIEGFFANYDKNLLLGEDTNKTSNPTGLPSLDCAWESPLTPPMKRFGDPGVKVFIRLRSRYTGESHVVSGYHDGTIFRGDGLEDTKSTIIGWRYRG